jgi:hypothetical protein
VQIPLFALTTTFAALDVSDIGLLRRQHGRAISLASKVPLKLLISLSLFSGQCCTARSSCRYSRGVNDGSMHARAIGVAISRQRDHGHAELAASLRRAPARILQGCCVRTMLKRCAISFATVWPLPRVTRPRRHVAICVLRCDGGFISKSGSRMMAPCFVSCWTGGLPKRRRNE